MPSAFATRPGAGRSAMMAAFVLLLGLRLLHLGPEIAQPHAWRQCDTAFFVRDFYENGIDLLHPSVCWMGNHRTVIFEFPLPEAAMALGYRLAGGEFIGVARLVTLLFFLGAVYFFYRIAALLFDRPTAELAGLIYVAFPLAQYYSTAVHIDYAALFFAQGMALYFMQAIRTQRPSLLLLSAGMAVPAFLIKAPYAFFLALPLLAFAIQEKRLRFFLPWSPLLLLPLMLFVWWQGHVYRVNGAMPDWSFIRGYRKFDNNSGWYFGTLAQRLDWHNWKLLLKRGWLDMAGILGGITLLAGLLQWRQHRIVSLWLLGAGLYVLIFFNLNRIHDYYQLPLLAPLALFMAPGLQRLSRLPEKWGITSRWPFWAFLLLMLAEMTLYAESRYYKIDENLIEIGRQIERHTPQGALPIVSYRDFDCRNPQILYRSRRSGWSVEMAALDTNVLERLRGMGASHWAFVAPQAPGAALKRYLAGLTPQKIPLSATPDTLFLYPLP